VLPFIRSAGGNHVAGSASRKPVVELSRYAAEA
jgi:hypothetical protein